MPAWHLPEESPCSLSKRKEGAPAWGLPTQLYLDRLGSRRHIGSSLWPWFPHLTWVRVDDEVCLGPASSLLLQPRGKKDEAGLFLQLIRVV